MNMCEKHSHNANICFTGRELLIEINFDLSEREILPEIKRLSLILHILVTKLQDLQHRESWTFLIMGITTLLRNKSFKVDVHIGRFSCFLLEFRRFYCLD